MKLYYVLQSEKCVDFELVIFCLKQAVILILQRGYYHSTSSFSSWFLYASYIRPSGNNHHPLQSIVNYLFSILYYCFHLNCLWSSSVSFPIWFCFRTLLDIHSSDILLTCPSFCWVLFMPSTRDSNSHHFCICFYFFLDSFLFGLLLFLGSSFLPL